MSYGVNLNTSLATMSDEALCFIFTKGSNVSVEKADKAKAELFKRWVGRIQGCIIRDFSNIANDAEDIAEKVVTSSIEAISRYGLQVPFRAYLYRAMHNEALQHKRKHAERRELEVPYCDASMDHHSKNLHASDRREQVHHERQMEAIKVALADLSPEERGILILEIYEGHLLKDIAEMYGVTPVTIRQRKSRALKKVRNHPAVKKLVAELKR
ncbi:MAG: sigma-70 family RNA polymerase sigma factor [Armatimonas sp.]